MVIGYEVSEDGTVQEIEVTKETLDPKSVICIIDEVSKSIFLWKGSQSGIRKKFIGARVATNLRSEHGFHFKVKPLDEGEEPPAFFSALDMVGAVAPPPKPKAHGPPPAPQESAPAGMPAASAPKKPTVPTETPQAPPPTPTAPPPTRPTTPPPKPRTTTTTPPPRPPTTTTRPSTTAAPTRVSVDQSIIDQMISELEQTDPPEGYQRELLIVYNELYTVVEHRKVVFGRETVEHRFEKVKDPPEGTFMAEGFIPRVIVKDGKVLGIELLKGTPEAILSPIKAEMKERLTDLISFFKSEIESAELDAPAKPASKKKRKKKLVAK